ncbi:MAG: HAD family hydrolase [Candidatus Saccharibacteria bacterium]
MYDSISGIIWDWNGTLLDDTDLSVQTMNQMLLKRNLQQLTMASYKEVFSFPVKDYYRKIGFDFTLEPFEIPAIEYIDIYNSQADHCNLHDHSITVLNHFKNKGIRQFILSAMEQEALNRCLELRQITSYFEHVSGLDNHYAASKLDNGKQMIASLGLETRQTLLIGDTIHDYEVACELGCKCILIANGHQSRSILESTGATVVNELLDLIVDKV